ncbi:MAG TPA: DUF1800 domain-containing protein [Terriglobales bacterium]|nr:DUF1800 domain-containing protein [Terriglobales bacterium]
MQFSRRVVVLGILLTLTLAGLTALSTAKKKPPVVTQMREQKRALHALQRLTFGPRPGDVDRVAALGVEQWIDLQLHPDKINDGALDTHLTPFRTLHMDTREIAENFPNEQMIKAVLDGKRPMPSDPVKRAVYQAQIERLQEKNERKQEAAAANPLPTATNAGGDQATGDSAAPTNDNTSARPSKLSDEQEAQHREDRLYADLKAQELLDKPPDQRMKEVLQMSPDEQRALSTSLKGQKADEFMAGMNPKQKEALQALKNPQQVVGDELMQAKLLRAIYSERQLDEVMTDFWFNHFNVFLGKGADRFLVTSYERDVIRPHALGKFEDLLVATAKSPAMMFYLDNWLSVGPESDIALGIRRNPNYYGRRRFPPPPRQVKGKGKRNGGLNENYGRELMELHTLGVNGGYTQRDVTEVARVLTGWTIDQPQKGGGFKFEERMHEPGAKIVLGHKIKQHGEKEGMEVLHLLAHHPSTARFICTKLAMRFVSDDPPPALVDRMAQTFLKKKGDIREVLQTLFASPEFWSDDAYRAKMKTPLEFVVSAVRATGADVTDAMPLARQLNTLGMPLYGMQPPTGYSMESDAWVNSSALLGRMNFSVALMSGKIKGVQVDADRLANAPPGAPADSTRALAALEGSLLAGDVSKQTHQAITSEIENQAQTTAGVKPAAARKNDRPAPASTTATIAGLILGSPEFQRR